MTLIWLFRGAWRAPSKPEVDVGNAEYQRGKLCRSPQVSRTPLVSSISSWGEFVISAADNVPHGSARK